MRHKTIALGDAAYRDGLERNTVKYFVFQSTRPSTAVKRPLPERAGARLEYDASGGAHVQGPPRAQAASVRRFDGAGVKRVVFFHNPPALATTQRNNRMKLRSANVAEVIFGA